jgi:hypothetical protein
MPIPVKPFTWVDSEGPDGLINALRLNEDFDVLYAALAASLDPDNIAPQSSTGPAICASDAAMKITGIWSFINDPVLKVGTGIAQLAVVQSFTELQSFAAGVDFLNSGVAGLLLTPETLPVGGPSLIGRIAFQGSDSHFYGWNGSTWVRLDYVGDYVGGTVVAYSSNMEVDDADSDEIFFKTEGASPTVKLALKGLTFPKRHYLCLPQHSHSFTGDAHAHAVVDAGHQHVTTVPAHGHVGSFALSTHYHVIQSLLTGPEVDSSGAEVTHSHLLPNLLLGGYLTSWSSSPTYHESVKHYHSLLGSTDVPSAVGNVSDTTIGALTSSLVVTGITLANATVTGTIGNAGVSVGMSIDAVAKMYGTALRVYIDATEITSLILAAKGWAAIGDGTGTHAFHVGGTGELDISSWLTFDPGIHTLRVVEPTTGYGCKVMAHVEIS